MEAFINWIIKNWDVIATAVGIGGGSGFAAKKLIDKKQDRQIADLENKVGTLDLDMLQLKNDIQKNTEFDKEFRRQMEKERLEIKADIRDVKKGMDTILGHLLNQKTN